ncbi:MAG: energy transducer TonB [Flavobacteriaceae bacterium]|nr:energy transducer TonB [Flavobacteriaceae bacterium]
MKTFYSINIPKPCHEDWNIMSPTNQGRFCDSCEKTVKDFTSMDTTQIRAYLLEHSQQHICGRVRREQLSPFQINIPMNTFKIKMSFHRTFLLALLISMGASLLSCSNGMTETQKIERVVIVASEEDIQKKFKEDFDILIQNSAEEELPIIMGALEVPATGNWQINKTLPIPFTIVDLPPQFQDTPKKLPLKEKRRFFKEAIRKHITTNFVLETFTELELSGRQRIFAKFTITETGELKDIQVRAQHPKVEKHTIEIIEKLPLFKPAVHKGEPIAVVYMVPILFQPI